MTYEAQLGCPITRQSARALFCPYANECELPVIQIKAEDHEQAQRLVGNEAFTDPIPDCLLGKPYLTKVSGNLMLLRRVDAA